MAVVKPFDKMTLENLTPHMYLYYHNTNEEFIIKTKKNFKMAQSESKAKRRKLHHEKATCNICNKIAPMSELSSPNDNDSWQTLYAAATLRDFESILQLAGESLTELPNVLIYYHRRCRSDFTHKKSLTKFQQCASSVGNVSSTPLRQSSRDEPSSKQRRVYERKCIFCLRVSKYTKGTRTRESLIPATELRADTKVREVAIARNNERLLAVTA